MLIYNAVREKYYFLYWFYKVVREKCCFYTGFTRLSANNIVFTMVLQGCPRQLSVFHMFLKLFRGQPRGHGFAAGAGGAGAGGPKLVRNSPSTTILSPLARLRSFASPHPLARTNETKRFPGWGSASGLTPPICTFFGCILLRRGTSY